MSAGTLALSEQGLLRVDPEDGAQSNGEDEFAASSRTPSKGRKIVFAAVIFSLVGAAGFLYHRYSSRTHSTAVGNDGLVERYAQYNPTYPATTSAAVDPQYYAAGTGAVADPQAVYATPTGATADPQYYAAGTGAAGDAQYYYPAATSAAADPQVYPAGTGAAGDAQYDYYPAGTSAAADPQVYPAGTGAAGDAQYYYPAGTSATATATSGTSVGVTDAAVIQAPAPAPAAPAPAPPAPAPPPPPAQIGGFYCWMVAANWGYEADLTKDAFAKKRGVFACDEYSILSNDAMPPVPTTKIGALNSKPASWGSYLNTEVFVRAWNSVLEQDKWSRHAWTIKADPDTVWFPQRLHGYVDKLDAHSAIFLRNSGDSYLGPLEVFSFGAVQKFAAQHSQLCGGDIGRSGEDGWIEGCMQNVGASEQENGNLLVSSTDVGACGNGAVVAFHPFKNVGSFNACFGKATR